MTDDEDWELVGFGSVAVDDVFTVTALQKNEKHKMTAARRLGGGQTETAFVAAARLGCRCFYGGILGTDDRSDFVRSIFTRENIGFFHNTSFPEASTVYAVVIVDQATGERTIVWTNDGVVNPVIGKEEERLIRKAKCLLADQNFPECQLRAAETARDAGVAVVGDYEHLDGEDGRKLLERTNHLIVPYVMTVRDFGESNPEKAVKKMIACHDRTLACVTDGAKGSWFATSDNPAVAKRQPAFVMPQIVDTTGCGDVFHGAYIASFIDGYPLDVCIRRAAAAAAIKTQKQGGQAGAPTKEELTRFLRFS